MRLALGADPDRVSRAVLWKGLSIVLGGLLLGLCGAAALGRWLGALLFGVEPLDLPVLLGVSLTMIAVAAAASYLPALRAAEVDPGIALRARVGPLQKGGQRTAVYSERMPCSTYRLGLEKPASARACRMVAGGTQVSIVSQ